MQSQTTDRTLLNRPFTQSEDDGRHGEQKYGVGQINKHAQMEDVDEFAELDAWFI
jgi:hypothetical protein